MDMDAAPATMLEHMLGVFPEWYAVIVMDMDVALAIIVEVSGWVT